MTENTKNNNRKKEEEKEEERLEERLEEFWDFVLTRLKNIKEKTIKNYSKNSQNRKHNVFNCINDYTIRRYMGLGRSFDSKLGNEIQKIAMKLARVKYGDINVPNIILINTEDENNNRKFKLNLYTIKDNFQQRVFYNIKSDDFFENYDKDKIESDKSTSIEFTLHKNDIKANLTQLNKRKITEKKESIDQYKKFLVDLLYIENIDDTTKTKITTFELKSGGNLDTKNSIANVNEVKLLKDIFKFFPQNDSFFATTYNNAGEGSPSGSVFAELLKNNLESKVGVDFWNMVLPEELDYERFINNYKQKFIESGIEEGYKSLDTIPDVINLKKDSKKKKDSKIDPKKIVVKKKLSPKRTKKDNGEV